MLALRRADRAVPLREAIGDGLRREYFFGTDIQRVDAAPRPPAQQSPRTRYDWLSAVIGWAIVLAAMGVWWLLHDGVGWFS